MSRIKSLAKRSLGWAIGLWMFAGVSWSQPRIFQDIHRYAVVIGIDAYPLPWDHLTYAVNDAKAIAKLMSDQGWDVISFYDGQASKEAIDHIFDQLETRVRPNDQMIFFFAGHGYTTRRGVEDQGFIVPFGADETVASLVSMAELRRQSMRLANPNQQLFIMDSCYGGTAVANVRVTSYLQGPGTEDPSSVRLVITAGGKDEEVSDGGARGHSIFAAALLQGLTGAADLNRDGYVSASELAAYLQRCASTLSQKPLFGSFDSLDQGDIFLKLRVVSATGQGCPATPELHPPKALTACDLNGDGKVDIIDVQLSISEALGTLECSDHLERPGRCTVVDVQRVINAMLGQACRVGP